MVETDWAADADLAAAIARTAGGLLQQLQQSGLLRGRALGDAGDALAQCCISRILAAHRPEDGVLSEEDKTTSDRLDKRRVWIVDPLDGTREYSEGRADYAVHVALAIDGVATLGAVAQPGLGLVYDSERPVALSPIAAPTILVSRSRMPAWATALAEQSGLTLTPMGSAGAKTMAVLRGEAMAYVHAGGQYEWDSAAPVAVAAASGLCVTRLDGSALRYNQADPYLPDLIVVRPEFADRLQQILRSIGAIESVSG